MPDGKKNGRPTITSAAKKKAKELMQSYFRKKKLAYEQEKIGRAQIKNKVEADRFGNPIGKQRLAIAAKARKEATRDSTRAVQLNPGLIKKKKK